VKELKIVFRMILSEEEVNCLIEDLIKWDVLDCCDNELFYTHNLNESEEKKYKIWLKFRAELLTNGFPTTDPEIAS
jgi:hypothetical protein